MERKKELKKAYMEKELPMGILQIKNEKNHKLFLLATSDLKGKENSCRFQLKNGSFLACHALQKDWQQEGADTFRFEVLDLLSYEKEGGKENYREDLQALLELWKEKLTAELGPDCFYKA